MVIAVVMKKYIIPIMALCAALSSCSKDSYTQKPAELVAGESSELLPGIRYEAFTIKTDGQSKTILDGTTCKWSEGDAFKVYSDPVGYSSATSFAKKAGENSFEGQVPEGTTDFYAVYASQQNSASYSSGKFSASVTIPAIQAAVAGGFDPAAHVAFAHGTRTPGDQKSDITFHSVIRLIMVSVPANVTSVTLSSETAISGTVTISFDGTAASTEGVAGNKSVSLSNGGSVIPEGTYHLCVAPVDMDGFQMTYTFTDGSTYTRSSAKTLAMAASNQIRNLTMSIPEATSADLSASGFFTSYNYGVGDGVSKDVAKANAMSSTAMENGSISFNNGWGRISTDSESYSIDGGADKAITELPSVSVWKTYSITVSASLGGKKVNSAAVERYITGLPYLANSNTTFSEWSFDSASWQDSYLRIKKSISFDKFKLPANIDVTVHSKYGAGYATVATNFSIEVSSEPILFFEGKGGALNTKGNEAESRNDGTLIKANPKISCKSSYSLGNTQSRLWFLGVYYR